MASGKFYLTEAYNSQSSDCVEAYVSWSSKITSGLTHRVTMDLYAKRTDYSGATTIQYGTPSGWTVTWTGGTVFSGGSFIHICTVQTTVTSNSSGVASFSGATFYAGFYSSSYGTRRMSGSVPTLQLDKPKVSVSISNNYSDGISCSVSNSSPSVGDEITFTITITNTAKYSGYNITVSGATLNSGTTYKVTGNVSVVITGTIKEYRLSITQTPGITVSVKSGDISYNNGNMIPYGTEISIDITISNGYDFISFVVDDEPYQTAETVTVVVVANISVSASARQSGVVYIRDGSGSLSRYQVYIYTDGWSLYKPMLYSDLQWNTCS